jgi:hypothetical protein
MSAMMLIILAGEKGNNERQTKEERTEQRHSRRQWLEMIGLTDIESANLDSSKTPNTHAFEPRRPEAAES